MIYLDHAATTHVRPVTRSAMQPFLDDAYGNPSGLHSVSRTAKNAMELAREDAAEMLGAARPFEIVFTGGGTEADNLGVMGPVLGDPSRTRGAVTVATEHEAVLHAVHALDRFGYPTAVVGVDRSGQVDPSALGAAAVETSAAVVSVMTANNETGVVHPIRTIATTLSQLEHPPLLHTDAVQAFVSEDITVGALGADMISVASHKFGGPKGVGLLYVRNGIELEPVLHGGGQELGRRSGTHNVAGIVGMVAAMRETVSDRERFRDRVGAIRDTFESTLKGLVGDVTINAPLEHRLVQHSHINIPGVLSETLLIRLDAEGVAAAAGSACQSGAIEISHVLEAMGFDDQRAGESVRFTFGWTSTTDEAVNAATIVADLVEDLR